MAALYCEALYNERRLADAEAAADWAADRVLQNMTLYTEWLADQCGHAEFVPIGYVPRDAVDLDLMIRSADVPMPAALSLYPRADVAFAACQALRDRYANDPGTKANIRSAAGRWEGYL